jgi:PAS domain S-box-containing protein
LPQVSPTAVLEAILASSGEGIIVCTTDGVVQSWNRAAEEILGYTADEAIGHDVARFVSHRSSLEAFALAAALQGQADTDTVHGEGVHKSGQRIAVTLTRTPIRNEDGTIAAGLIVLRAATSSSAVSQSDSERLSLALASARLGDWSWDAKSDVVTLSQRAAEIFGNPLELQMTWTAMRGLLHEDDRERARLAVEQALADRSDYALEYRVIHEGGERWVHASGRGRYGAHGEVLGMLGVCQDITSDRLLVRLDDAVRPLVQPDEITSMAARVLGQHLKVHRCAYAFVEDDEDTFILTGNYTSGVQSIIGRYRFREFGAECLRLMRAGEPYVVEDAGLDPRIDDDDRRAYAFTEIRAVICVPILKEKRFVAAMAVHMNDARHWSEGEVELVQQVASRCWESIERSKVERERQGLLQAAEAANRTKDEFLAMLGHELRNPLAPILTALQLMKIRNDAASQRERDVIERQVQHLTRLVDDLLDVSRIAGGKVLLKKELLELSEVVNGAIELTSPVLEARAHALELDVPTTGLLVHGDAARLTQVVSNILSNAGKYTPVGGRIAVSAVVEGDDVLLRVMDTGMGIAADVLPHVFDLFVQGRQAIDRAQGGLGLGLAIVRSLVHQHGGRVDATSGGPDKGSEFVVRLPHARESRPAADNSSSQSQHVEAASPPLAARLLIVDDNEDAAEMLAEALQLRGCSTHVAHDGPEALALAAAHGFDAALLDIGLPVMDGYELVARLRELPSLQETTFVALTGYGQSSDRDRALDAGFHHHLVKPINFVALSALIAGLQRRECG